jgi:hypothetical protein
VGHEAGRALVVGGDPGRVLAPVLEDQERLMNPRTGISTTGNADNPTHKFLLDAKSLEKTKLFANSIN